ncbi:MAG: DEAD/DEAH box helicase [Myxococcota bacterium]|nr:DEAD/DEAH box helicase [Myxococcota bacterium]
MCSHKRIGRLAPKAIAKKWATSETTGDIAVNTTSAARPATWAPYPDWLDPAIVASLGRSGVSEPYSHQVAAWHNITSGQHTVIATPTASGKTLCYNVPVLHRQLQDPTSCALYLFPTKALARDQEAGIRSLFDRIGARAQVQTYDGDTPAADRARARNASNIIITNPDMMHMGILPHHTQWASFFSNLSYVVIDELHTYRGVFGSHVANVFRRLQRLAAHYGSSPVFVACSATIQNPVELARKVTGKSFVAIEESGAPLGARTLAICNPEMVDVARGIRRSTPEQAARLTADLIAAQLSTIVFCRSRRAVEVILRYVRDRLTRNGGDPTRVRGYRGGYLPEIRRDIETLLKKGALDAVVATNALELGIDIGSLDAVVMAGYPGTIAGFHQRAGRAGRRHGPSLAVLVTSANPIDQFLAQQPAYLLQATPECALLEPNNVEILLSHLRCAAFELPFDADEGFGDLSTDDTWAALDCLVADGDLTVSGQRAYYIKASYPAADISLRSIAAQRVVVIDREGGDVIAEIDAHLARSELHDGAIYLADGETYFVHHLDLEKNQAQVSRIDGAYYTVPHRTTVVDISSTPATRPLGNGVVAFSDLTVMQTIAGFKKIRFHTHENLGYGPLDLPPMTLETEGAWLTPSDALYNLLNSQYDPGALARGFAGFAHALHQVACLHLMCDPGDVSHAVQKDPSKSAPFEKGNGGDFDRTSVAPTMSVFLYDAYAGGVGLSERAFDQMAEIVSDTEKLIRGCACEVGCPSCIGPVEAHDSGIKAAAAALARGCVGLAPVAQ